MVIEDEQDFRFLLTHVLEQAGYRVSSASNGESGMDLYVKNSPDLVILDVNLPDTDGFEICRRIRSDGPRPQTPIIICTIRSQVAPVTEGLASGATEYIIKPFEIQDFLSRVSSVLDDHSPSLKRGR